MNMNHNGWSIHLLFTLAVLLSRPGATLAQDHAATSTKGDATPAVCVVLIGGIDSDPTPEQIAGTARRGEGQSGMFQLAGDLAAKGLATEYFNWNGTRAGKIKEKAPFADGIVQWVRDHHAKVPRQRLTIVANSWGGHTAWEVCEGLAETEIPIELALFVDPSSTGRAKSARPTRLPTCIKSARNYYTRNLFGWRDWPDETRLINIDLGDPKHGFLVEGGPKYDATFDVKAHIHAEWDQRIHQELVTQLLKLLERPVKDDTTTSNGR
jgi:hypothetical protein